jgi:hypothetical protein
MTLRFIIMVFGIVALIAQFFLGLHEDTNKQRDNESLQSKLKQIEDGINGLVSQGKLASSDARKLLVVMTENVQFHENLQIEVIPGRGEK